MTKPTKWHVCPAKTRISLGIRQVWSESSLSAWRKFGYLATHWAHSEDSDQTGRMPESPLGAQSFCWFCHEAAHLFSCINVPNFQFLEIACFLSLDMSHSRTKPPNWPVHLAKTDQPRHPPCLISLRCLPDGLDFYLFINCTAKTRFRLGDLIRPRCTVHFVGFVSLICKTPVSPGKWHFYWHSVLNISKF